MMEVFIATLFSSAFVLALFLLLGYVFYLIFLSFIDLCCLYRPLIGIKVWYTRLPQAERDFLFKNNKYYSTLNDSLQKEFEYRIILFLKNKKFIAKRFDAVSREMKLLIGSSAVQLTFGFHMIVLRHFQKIFVYPEAYTSSTSGRKHKGEVNSAGAIVFSWEDFLIGYRNPTDGINVGLHEMAHALYLEDFIRNGEDNFLDSEALQDFERSGKIQINIIRNGESSFIRKYGATNKDEFFAVAIEQFFEQPEEFYNSLPNLYKRLGILLKQNPKNKSNPII